MRFRAMGLPMIPKPTKPTRSGILIIPLAEGIHPPLYRALQGVMRKGEAVPLALQAQAMQLAVFGEAEQTFGCGGACAADHQLYLAPIHPPRALRELYVRDRRALP